MICLLFMDDTNKEQLMPANSNGIRQTIVWGRVVSVMIAYLYRRLNPMMTSSNGNIVRVTGPLCGEFTCHRWIPLIKASDAELWCFLWWNGWVNNRDAGDLSRHRAHYDVTVMRHNFRFTKVIAISVIRTHSRRSKSLIISKYRWKITKYSFWHLLGSFQVGNGRCQAPHLIYST